MFDHEFTTFRRISYVVLGFLHISKSDLSLGLLDDCDVQRGYLNKALISWSVVPGVSLMSSSADEISLGISRWPMGLPTISFIHTIGSTSFISLPYVRLILSLYSIYCPIHDKSCGNNIEMCLFQLDLRAYAPAIIL